MRTTSGWVSASNQRDLWLKKYVFQYLDLSSRTDHKEFLQYQVIFALVQSKWEAKTAEGSLTVNGNRAKLCSLLREARRY